MYLLARVNHCFHAFMHYYNLLVLFALFFIIVWNKLPWRNLWLILFPRHFCSYSFDDSTYCQHLLYNRSISPKMVLIFPKDFIFFRLDWKVGHNRNYSSTGKSRAGLSDSMVAFWRKLGGTSHTFLYYVFFIHSNISCNETDVGIRRVNMCFAIDKFESTWKSDFLDNIK